MLHWRETLHTMTDRRSRVHRCRDEFLDSPLNSSDCHWPSFSSTWGRDSCSRIESNTSLILLSCYSSFSSLPATPAAPSPDNRTPRTCVPTCLGRHRGRLGPAQLPFCRLTTIWSTTSSRKRSKMRLLRSPLKQLLSHSGTVIPWPVLLQVRISRPTWKRRERVKRS